jgi:16S rRNA (adenine1518-N6/adenine1519-N6)-dimethyltransferase
MGYRKFGQHFLIDKQVAEREVDYADPNKNDVVLEIGPGKGILTRLLAEKVKKVIAVEIDPYLVKKLESTLPDNVMLINADAIEIDFKTLPAFNKIVSNLPFQISSPVTFKFLRYPFSKAVLIYQKDFAERMAAAPNTKHYSRLSVGIYYKTECVILETVPKKCFYPVPKVDSSIVELTRRETPPFTVLDEKFFFDLTKTLFNHRRKKIRNILKDIYGKLEDIPYLDKRVEEITPEQIGELSNLLYNKM